MTFESLTAAIFSENKFSVLQWVKPLGNHAHCQCMAIRAWRSGVQIPGHAAVSWFMRAN